MVLVAKEAGGRVRLAHVENNDDVTLKRFVDANITDAAATTDGLASYNPRSLGERRHAQRIQTAAERRESDALQGAHWSVSLLKRWLLGTHGGGVKTKHLQSYLDEFIIRYNRLRTTVSPASRHAPSNNSSSDPPSPCVKSSIKPTQQRPSRIQRDRHVRLLFRLQGQHCPQLLSARSRKTMARRRRLSQKPRAIARSQ